MCGVLYYPLVFWVNALEYSFIYFFDTGDYVTDRTSGP